MVSRGFTLFHVVVVTLFFSLLLSTGFPLLYSYMQFTRLHGASQLITGALVDARINAVEQYRPVVLCSSQDGLNCDGIGHWEQGFIAFVDEDSNGRRNGSEYPHVINGPLDTGATIRSEFPDAYQVVYLPDGRVKSTDSFNICISAAPASGRTIEVNISGRPKPRVGASYCPDDGSAKPLNQVAHR